MRQYLGSLGGWLLNLVLWVWFAVPKVLDWVGRSTLPEDWEVLMSEKLPAWVAWLFTTPSWVPAVLAATLTLWLVYVSRPIRHQSPATVSSDAPQVGMAVEAIKTVRPEIIIEQQARDDLEKFVTEHLIDTCVALIHLQSEMVRRLDLPEQIQEMVINGLTRRWDLRDFDAGYELLSGFSDSPPSVPNAEELVGGVDQIEKGYPTLCKQGQEIANTLGVKFGADTHIDRIYEDWRNSHNATVEAYKTIKGDPRMRRDEILIKLHRPVRPTRFGTHIRPPKTGEILPISVAD